MLPQHSLNRSMHSTRKLKRHEEDLVQSVQHQSRLQQLEAFQMLLCGFCGSVKQPIWLINSVGGSPRRKVESQLCQEGLCDGLYNFQHGQQL